jgi:hypothetical protein
VEECARLLLLRSKSKDAGGGLSPSDGGGVDDSFDAVAAAMPCFCGHGMYVI